MADAGVEAGPVIKFWYDVIRAFFANDVETEMMNVMDKHAAATKPDGTAATSYFRKVFFQFSDKWYETYKNDDLVDKMQAVFVILTPKEMVYVARLATEIAGMVSRERAHDRFVHDNFSLDVPFVSIFKALKRVGYDWNQEENLDMTDINKATRVLWPKDPRPIKEQIEKLALYVYPDRLRDLYRQIKAILEEPSPMTKSANFNRDNNDAEARFSRAQIIDALQKTKSNPKLAAALLLGD